MGLLNNGISILHFDETYTNQRKLLSYQHENIDLRKLRNVHLYCENVQQIRFALSKRRKKGITFIGSGNYHYTTYILLQELKKPFTLVLFDNHTDIDPSENATEKMISCGSWVSFALANIPMLKQVVIIGPSSIKLTSSRFSDVTILPFKNAQPYSFKRILSEIEMGSVYISIDKDILNQTAAVTNWDQGNMNISTLIPYLKSILTNKNVYGIDICGELPPSPVLAFQQSYQRSIRKNESTNLKILQTCIAFSRSKLVGNKNLA